MITQRFSGTMHLREIQPRKASATILYLHGLGESCLAFEGLLQDEALQTYCQLAPDLPGYGKSPWPTAANGLEETATAVGNWLSSRLEVEQKGPVVILGHSMGGVLGLLLCEQFPHLVRGLINVEGNISEEDCGFSRRIAAFEGEEFATDGFAQLLQETYREGLNDPPLQTYFASMRFCDPRTLHRCATELVEISRQESLASRLAALNLPQTYILGSPRGTGAHSRALLDRASIPWQAIGDAGHWVFLDQPRAFSKILVTELERILP